MISNDSAIEFVLPFHPQMSERTGQCAGFLKLTKNHQMNWVKELMSNLDKISLLVLVKTTVTLKKQQSFALPFIFLPPPVKHGEQCFQEKESFEEGQIPQPLIKCDLYDPPNRDDYVAGKNHSS